MGDDSLALFDFFDDVFPTSELVLFPRRNPFDDYDEKKFRARYRLSNSSVVSRLVEEVMNITTRHNTTARCHAGASTPYKRWSKCTMKK